MPKSKREWLSPSRDPPKLNGLPRANNAKTLGLVKCPFCTCYFANEGDLQLHIWALHTGQPLKTRKKGGGLNG